MRKHRIFHGQRYKLVNGGAGRCLTLGYDGRMRKELDLAEGPEAFRRFDNLMVALLAVPREEILRREAEYKRASDANPRKRGPKRKASAASPGPGASKI